MQIDLQTNEQLVNILHSADNVAVIPAKGAGVDSFCAGVAMHLMLKALDKNSKLLYSEAVPESCKDLVKESDIITAFSQRQLTVSIDYAGEHDAKAWYEPEGETLKVKLAPVSKDFDPALKVHAKLDTGFDFDTAIILAGGEGIKLRPLTYELPKSLIPVQGKPLVEYTIELLRKAGIKNIVFATGHLGEKIIKYFGNGEKFGVRITYSQEKRRLGTAGALKNAASLLDGTFLAIHGDILVQINLLDLLQFHTQQNVTGTMVLTTTSDIQTHGNVRLRGARILEFLEKPKIGKSLSLLINTGIYVFEPSIFSYIPKSGISFLEEEIFPKLALDQQLSGFPFDGSWFDITNPQSYERALKYWKA